MHSEMERQIQPANPQIMQVVERDHSDRRSDYVSERVCTMYLFYKTGLMDKVSIWRRIETVFESNCPSLQKILQFIDPHPQAMLSVFFEGCAPWWKRATLDRLDKRRKRKLVEGGSCLTSIPSATNSKRQKIEGTGTDGKGTPPFWRAGAFLALKY
ncbi:hypothetical protein FRB95_012051 [Tulasnella sp. JGI-2019a]|nr:hypothetical protein FRB95_012051 [Tulasnella sp. JGI-2019a]